MVQKLMSMYRQDCEAADQQFQHQRDRQLQDMQVTAMDTSFMQTRWQ